MANKTKAMVNLCQSMSDALSSTRRLHQGLSANTNVSMLNITSGCSNANANANATPKIGRQEQQQKQNYMKFRQAYHSKDGQKEPVPFKYTLADHSTTLMPPMSIHQRPQSTSTTSNSSSSHSQNDTVTPDESSIESFAAFRLLNADNTTTNNNKSNELVVDTSRYADLDGVEGGVCGAGSRLFTCSTPCGGGGDDDEFVSSSVVITNDDDDYEYDDDENGVAWNGPQPLGMRIIESLLNTTCRRRRLFLKKAHEEDDDDDDDDDDATKTTRLDESLLPPPPPPPIVACAGNGESNQVGVEDETIKEDGNASIPVRCPIKVVVEPSMSSARVQQNSAIPDRRREPLSASLNAKLLPSDDEEEDENTLRRNYIKRSRMVRQIADKLNKQRLDLNKQDERIR